MGGERGVGKRADRGRGGSNNDSKWVPRFTDDAGAQQQTDPTTLHGVAAPLQLAGSNVAEYMYGSHVAHLCSKLHC
jgi:hypothetical protein